MGILESVLGVFDSIGDWIVTAVTDLMAMFYTSEGGLTLLGVLAVAGLAFSVIFLVSLIASVGSDSFGKIQGELLGSLNNYKIISSQGIYMQGSTTIRYGVAPSGAKCPALF